METSRNHGRRRAARRALTGAALAVGVLAASSVTASAATTATFSAGRLSVSGDSLNNSITISRDAAGEILVNGGAVAVIGGTPTGAKTALVPALRLGGVRAGALSDGQRAPPGGHPFRGGQHAPPPRGPGAGPPLCPDP